MENENNKYRPSFMIRFLRNKKARIGAVILMVGYTLYFVGAFMKNQLEYIDISIIVFKILPIVISVIGIGYFLYGYLEGKKPIEIRDNKNYQNTSFNEQDIQTLKRDFRRQFDEFRHMQEKSKYELRELIEQFSIKTKEQNELHLDENQRKEIFDSLKQSFTDNINEDFFKQLNENISIELTQEKRSRLELLLNDFMNIKKRLNSEIEKLSRKANLNLVIGSLTTVVALIGLGFVVFPSNGEFKGYADMLYHYIPRLSLIIFVEVFAYFFLKLYKLNLNDMKYFQNELTTVELKLSSLTTAINFGKDIDISAITLELSKTERNFILKKGETTVDLEKSRIDKSDIKEILTTISGIMNKKK